MGTTKFCQNKIKRLRENVIRMVIEGYKYDIKKIQRKIRRREKCLWPDEANKIDTASNLDRGAVKCKIVLLERDLAEAKETLRQYIQNTKD